ncbi:small integral membrane protein 29 isoform X2 [Pristis pectinata]|uniref:small integral membrane protein 29 isoform X2 n=1 Tax=Pristis pectinata TaxID=685728 RepID=UPI00223DFA37|nr:small integral membrane protein 29 isoform X2 [Pristis pectinata]
MVPMQMQNILVKTSNSSVTVPPTDESNAVAGFVLVPFFVLTVIGFTVAMVMYIQKRRRLDKLRHQLLPVYAYDPTEDLHEAEEELLIDSDEPKFHTDNQRHQGNC